MFVFDVLVLFLVMWFWVRLGNSVDMLMLEGVSFLCSVFDILSMVNLLVE